MFEPFLQGEGGLRKNEGTGLGLALSNRPAQLVGGSLSVHSEQHKGSTFAFIFPDGATFPPVRVESTLRVTGVAADWRMRKVLVVDDRESNRRLLSMALQSVGIPVCPADNGPEAIRAVADHNPCAVLMDLQMRAASTGARKPTE